MSTLFRLKYLMGMIPSASKIESDWADLLKIRADIQSMENSVEIIRFNELKALLNSHEFQFQKKDIQDLKFTGSSEYLLLNELDKLEKSRDIVDYFKVLKSNDLSRFQKIEGSMELQRFNELKEVVESQEFRQRKKETENYDYKASAEYCVRQEFNELSKNVRLKRYYKNIVSADYLFYRDFHPKAKNSEESTEGGKNKDGQMKRYQKFLKSKELADIQYVEKNGLAMKFEQLKKEINSNAFIEKEAFLKDKKRYEKTKDYPLFNGYTRLSKNKDILFYQKFKLSDKYTNFLRMKDSYELERLLELRKTTSESGFLERVSYLKNTKRYETTDFYKQEKEFIALDKSRIMKKYRQLKNSPKLDFFNQWSVVFDENFEKSELDRTRWQAENFWGFKLSGKSFSQAGEAQCYNGEKNLRITNNTLSILTKKEQLNGQIWSINHGLMPKEFNYSSGIINSGNSFRFRDGVVEAKVKFNSGKSVTNAFSLTGSTPMPQIDVFRSGSKCVGLGYTDMSNGSPMKKYKQIYGLNFNKYHVFRLEKFDHTLIWKINGVQVHSDYFSQSAGELFLNFVSSLHEPVDNNLIPHQFQIDWIRCYSRNHNNN